MVISRGFLDVSGLGGLPLYLPRGSADGTIRIWECTRKRQLKAGNSGRHPCWLMIVGGIILPYIYKIIYICVCVGLVLSQSIMGIPFLTRQYKGSDILHKLGYIH